MFASATVALEQPMTTKGPAHRLVSHTPFVTRFVQICHGLKCLMY
jgi:hypothetical protein